MWVLSTSRAELHFFPSPEEVPDGYATLSHVWDKKEQSFQDVRKIQETCAKDGTNPRDFVCEKIKRSCMLAESRKLKWIWIDTCCIDKTSSADLSEAINSMFRYYSISEICLGYLRDVVSRPLDPTNPYLDTRSVWFTRGWTLQELIAPRFFLFVSKTWEVLGSRDDFALLLDSSLGIPAAVLQLKATHTEYSIAQRMSWFGGRRTTRVEDEAYCLLGIFDIYMPPLYGEGKNAFRRLQEEIMKQSPDTTLFSWAGGWKSDDVHSCLLAPTPSAFNMPYRISYVPGGYSQPRTDGHDRGTELGIPVKHRADMAVLPSGTFTPPPRPTDNARPRGHSQTRAYEHNAGFGLPDMPVNLASDMTGLPSFFTMPQRTNYAPPTQSPGYLQPRAERRDAGFGLPVMNRADMTAALPSAFTIPQMINPASSRGLPQPHTDRHDMHAEHGPPPPGGVMNPADMTFTITPHGVQAYIPIIKCNKNIYADLSWCEDRSESPNLRQDGSSRLLLCLEDDPDNQARPSSCSASYRIRFPRILRIPPIREGGRYVIEGLSAFASWKTVLLRHRPPPHRGPPLVPTHRGDRLLPKLPGLSVGPPPFRFEFALAERFTAQFHGSWMSLGSHVDSGSSGKHDHPAATYIFGRKDEDRRVFYSVVIRVGHCDKSAQPTSTTAPAPIWATVSDIALPLGDQPQSEMQDRVTALADNPRHRCAEDHIAQWHDSHRMFKLHTEYAGSAAVTLSFKPCSVNPGRTLVLDAIYYEF